MAADRRTGRSFRQQGRWLGGALGVIILGGVSGALLLSRGQATASAEPAIPLGASLATWEENGQDGRYLLQILEGGNILQGTRVSGIVASDTNCSPDERGFSHCHNAITLAGGARVTVVNTHLMNRYRCLYPGERVALTKIDPSWVVATVVSR